MDFGIGGLLDGEEFFHLGNCQVWKVRKGLFLAPGVGLCTKFCALHILRA